ncbi:MAG: CrcB family protein [Microbacteriaceae bacterium]|nr:CrcB family protein [Microbacteriaceae bacterium]
MTWALVLGAGVVGALLRHGAVVRFGRGERFPVVILVVNATGSLLAGALAGLAFSLPAPWLAILATGFCGALTTFSTFSVDTVRLALAGRGWAALGNVLGSIALGLGCAALGAAIALAVV